MRVVHSPLHARHDGGMELHRGELVPCFEMPARVDYILRALERVAFPVEAPRDFAPQALLGVHDAGFVEFLRTAYAQWVAVGKSGFMLPSGFPARGMRRDRIPAGINGRMGYYAFDAGTPMVEGTWDAARAAAHCALTAAALVVGGERSAYALCRPPGHHAGHATYGGYCFLNNAALAAQYLRDSGFARVAVLDIDYHHGNGTQDIFYDEDRVLYLSSHQSPFYPGTGKAGEVGEGVGRGFTANVPLPAGSGEDVYAAAFAGVFVPLLREFGPEVILVSAGFDAHIDDLLGGMALESGSFGRFAALISGLSREVGAAPPAFVLEGGYNLNALTESVAATMQGVHDEPPDWEYAGGVMPVEKSREALAPFWRSLR
jgi:acetoin utilization deacetylase AcuC-like enzyme